MVRGGLVGEALLDGSSCVVGATVRGTNRPGEARTPTQRRQWQAMYSLRKEESVVSVYQPLAWTSRRSAASVDMWCVTPGVGPLSVFVKNCTV